ncbi:outer membrane protein assembly factor BamE [Motiliproteus sediminis]|uniref:outer membrane protein assembly factor BamE n=1 Tax=Motiliproteus sediminis TaxID=1468178 RepID=UPI001AEF3718|nr:outer membrane protein assembly factor BamE [Motiliproteus sediminis]
MQKVIISILALTLAGCSFFPGVHKIDIQQGNVITQEQVDQLRPGMSRSQVRFVLGTPAVTDTFHQDRWDYLYTLQEGGGERQQQRLTLYFDDDKLSRLSGDFRPQP